ncbi:MAG: aldehyde ferredoxin oxidoreductase N-terminal domain-containing protein, partial [bacterium]
MNCLMGKMLYVDLSSKTVEVRETPKEWVDLYAGQKGLASRILMDEITPDTDPFSPDNCIVLATSIMA